MLGSSLLFSFFPSLFFLDHQYISTTVLKTCACARADIMSATQEKEEQGKQESVSSTSRRGARAAFRDEYPRDFGWRMAYTVS